MKTKAKAGASNPPAGKSAKVKMNYGGMAKKKPAMGHGGTAKKKPGMMYGGMAHKKKKK